MSVRIHMHVRMRLGISKRVHIPTRRRLKEQAPLVPTAFRHGSLGSEPAPAFLSSAAFARRRDTSRWRLIVLLSDLILHRPSPRRKGTNRSSSLHQSSHYRHSHGIYFLLTTPVDVSWLAGCFPHQESRPFVKECLHYVQLREKWAP